MPSTPTRTSIEDRTPLLGSSASLEPSSTSTPAHDLPDEDGGKPALRQGQATVLSCIANLANTIIGTGALAMAHAFSGEGLIPGSIMVLLCATTAYFGLYLLTRSAQLAPHRSASFSSLSQLTFPGLTRLFDGAVALKCFGVSISYLIVIGGLMPKVVKSFDPMMDPNTIWLDRRVWILASMTLLCPLAFLRRLDSLKVTSYIALCAIAYLVFIVLYYTFLDSSELPPRGTVELFRFEPSFIQSLPVQIFAFTCAQNIFAVFNELKDNSQPQLDLVIGTSIGSAAAIYEVLGILGYLAFGSKVGGNLIEMYPHSTAVSICQSGIVILVLFSYPLQLHPCRASLDKLLFPTRPTTTTTTTRSTRKTRNTNKNSNRFRDGSDSETEQEQSEEEEEDSSTILSTESQSQETEIPLTRFIVESSVILFSTFVIAMFVSSLETVLGFVGATGSTTISFILPSIFFLSLFKHSDDPKDRKLRVLAWLLLLWGFLVMILSLSMNIYHLMVPPETDNTTSLHTLGLLGGKPLPIIPSLPE
ncbi:aspartate/glutamate transporter [Sporobolomyces koalae]|uniref:aspartate/glutamate transporter n=1 Tax=Sporobolomyces koalae TaxID=500713 RepID=UPI0031774E8A